MKLFRKAILVLLTCLMTVALALGFVACGESSYGGDTSSGGSGGTQNQDTAKEIEVNTTVTDNLSESKEKDWFKFTVAGEGYVEIEFTHETVASSKNHWCIDFYTSDKTTGYAQDSGRTYWDVVGNENKTTPKMGIEAGTYYIEIQRSSSAWSDVNYQLNVKFMPMLDWETENNNTYEKADELKLNTVKKGTIVKSNDVDWYKFEIPANGYITLDFTHEVVASTKNHWRFHLFTSDATTGYAIKPGNGAIVWDVVGNENRSSDELGISAGVYYIKATQYSNWSNVEYTVKVNFTEAANWETELNHTYDKANDMTVNTPINGTLAYGEDVDWYKFEIPSAGYITIDFKHEVVASTKNHWCMDLYYSDAVTGYGLKSGRTYWDVVGNKDFTTSAMGVDAGTYYIQVQRSSAAHERVPYNITVNFTEATDWEKESNNTYDKATDLAVNTTVNGSLIQKVGLDWYKIEVPTAGKVQVKFNHVMVDTSSKTWCVDFYQSDAVTGVGKTSGRTYWDIKGNENFNSGDITLTEGTYYILIQKASSNWSSAQYELTVTFTSN